MMDMMIVIAKVLRSRIRSFRLQKWSNPRSSHEHFKQWVQVFFLAPSPCRSNISHVCC